MHSGKENPRHQQSTPSRDARSQIDVKTASRSPGKTFSDSLSNSNGESQMKQSSINSAIKAVKATLAACTVALPLTVTNAAYANTVCTPVVVSGLTLTNVERIGTTGFKFKVRSALKNSNRTVAYAGNKQSRYTVSVSDADGRRLATTDPFDLGFSLQPNRSLLITSKQSITAMRDPGNLAQTLVTVRSLVFNAQCPSGKNTWVANYTFDLAPALNGKQPRRISARMSGYSEASRPRPRPRPGQGAPRPRS